MHALRSMQIAVERERERERGNFNSPFSQHWLMRTSWLESSAQVENGCQAVADSLLVLMSHLKLCESLQSHDERCIGAMCVHMTVLQGGSAL